MGDVRVSVVIPAYRCAGIIGHTLDGLLAQTRRPDEIIVVDDGSPDDLVTALAPYRGQVTLLRKANGGASSARNAGLDVSTGDLIAFCDSDDIWHPTKLASQLAIFEKHPEVGLVSSRYLIREAVGEPYLYPDLSEATWDQVLRPRREEAFRLAMVVWTSVVMFRRSVLGSDRFDTTLTVAEDRDLWVRLVARAPIYFQSEATTTLVERSDSLSRQDLDLDCNCMLRIIRRHGALIGARGQRRWEASTYRRWAGTYLARGRARKAIAPGLQRLTYQPFSPEAWWILGKSALYALLQSRASANGRSAAPVELVR